MGGYGSTRWGWHNKKHTVESSLKITVTNLFKYSIPLNKANQRGGFLSWKNRDRTVGSLMFALDLKENNPILVLNYSANKQSFNYSVSLTTTPCRYGGARYWFSCLGCQRRCACLYLPLTQSNSLRFYCRKCHNLTYDSAQRAHEGESGGYLGIISRNINQILRLEKLEQKLMRLHYGSLNYIRTLSKMNEIHKRIRQVDQQLDLGRKR